MTEEESGSVQMGVRRRPTRRHRRNRLIRRAVLILTLASFAAGLSAVALRYLSPSLFRSSQVQGPSPAEAEASRDRVLQANEDTFAPNSVGRPVYPYSVVPGGVEDARELKWVAEHDPVVATHYAGFDFQRARVVRLALAQTVYLSYRIGNKVYWTRHRIALHKGEKLITDGKITARTRCGNRVETVPQQATSSSEPPAAKFEDPFGGGAGTAAQSPPVPFQSALLSRPGAPGIGPQPPLSLYSPFSTESWVPIAPPPLPVAGVCEPINKKGTEAVTIGETGKKKVACRPPESVPEPGTWLLFATGLAGIYFWRIRNKRAQVPDSFHI
ncbi:MAG: PEP-CTERM sorting domain-containing protein [Candidatus Sulfotelmatobacter sp.]